jgi:hypothetical protein
MEYVAWSFRLDIGRPDHLAPLLSFLGDVLPEVGVSFIRIWSPSPETGDWRGIPVSVSEADSLVSLFKQRASRRRINARKPASIGGRGAKLRGSSQILATETIRV